MLLWITILSLPLGLHPYTLFELEISQGVSVLEQSVTVPCCFFRRCTTFGRKMWSIFTKGNPERGGET